MIASLIALSASILSAAPDPAPCSVDDIAFIAGHWRADLGGTLFEEITMPPAHGNMTGSMRMVPNAANEGSAVRLWELISFDEEDGHVLMRIRHYSPGLDPWKVEAENGPLVVTATEVVPGESVVFSDLNDEPRVVSITYEISDDDGLTATVVTSAQSSPLVIEYERVE